VDYWILNLTNEYGVKIFDFKSTSYEKVMELLIETFDGCVVTTVSNDPGNYDIKPYKTNTI
jgi:hypothetical protein